jgi:hypothetical protein
MNWSFQRGLLCGGTARGMRGLALGAWLFKAPAPKGNCPFYNSCMAASTVLCLARLQNLRQPRMARDCSGPSRIRSDAENRLPTRLTPNTAAAPA